jgi:hypothetical protein
MGALGALVKSVPIADGVVVDFNRHGSCAVRSSSGFACCDNFSAAKKNYYLTGCRPIVPRCGRDAW